MVWVDNVIISKLTVLRLFMQADVCIYDASMMNQITEMLSCLMWIVIN